MQRLSLKKIAIALIFVIPLLVVLLQKKPLRADSNVQIIYKNPGATSAFKLGYTYRASGTEMGTPELKSKISGATSSVDILNQPILGSGPYYLWTDGTNINPDSWHWTPLKTQLDAISSAKQEVFNGTEAAGHVGPDKMITMGTAPSWMTTSTQKNYIPLGTFAGKIRQQRSEGNFPAFPYYHYYWEMYSDNGTYPLYGTNQPYPGIFGERSWYNSANYTDSVADDPANGCQVGMGYTPIIKHSDPGSPNNADEAIYRANPFRCDFRTDYSKVDTWHVLDFAYMAKKIAERNGGDYYQVWQNLSGYWDAQNNTYDYAGFMGLWNSVYTAVKQGDPDSKVGGPYVTVSYWSNPANASNPETIDQCKGSWGVFDKRDIDAVRYWLDNKTGGDFINVSFSADSEDAQTGTGNTGTVGYGLSRSNNPAYREFQVKEKIAALKNCIDAVKTASSNPADKLLPVSISELKVTANYGNNVPNQARANALYANTIGETINSGFDYVLMNDVRYVTQLDGTLKGIRDTFGSSTGKFGQEKEGTVLYSPTFDESKIGVFASAKGIMLVNKQNSAEPTSINSCYPINLGAYEVKFIDLADCNPPETPPNFTAQVDGRNVNLTWGESTDVESLIAGYRVYRSGSNQPIASLDANARSYTDTYNGSTNTTFSYYVTAVDAFGNESQRAKQENIQIITGVETLQDTSVSCTVLYQTSNSCSIDLPEYCQSALSINPTHGTSVVANGKITYTSNNTSTVEENYAHLRQRDTESKKCNVNVKFVAAPDPLDPLQDVSVSCTVSTGSNACSVVAPAYCQSTLSLQPAHGTSTISDGKIVYTSNGTSRVEENYAHLRQRDAESKKCNVNIKFANNGTGGGGNNNGGGGNNNNNSGGSNTGTNTNVKLPGNPKTGARDFGALKIIIPIAVVLSLISGFVVYKKRSVSGTR